MPGAPGIPGIDFSKPSPARIYDYLLGGKDNYGPDRAAAEEMLAADPDLANRARQNRQFLTTAVSRAAGAGLGQFLDLGAGFPAHPSLHEAARQADPSAVTVLVDTDLVVLSHARALLAVPGEVGVVEADLADAGAVLGDPEAGLLDLSRPVCVVFGAVLHYWDAGTARGIVRAYAARLAAGSRVIISVPYFTDPDLSERIRDRFGAGAHNHGPGEVEAFLDGLEILPPGVTSPRRWIAGIAGLSCKRAWMACAAGKVPGGEAGLPQRVSAKRRARVLP